VKIINKESSLWLNERKIELFTQDSERRELLSLIIEDIFLS